MPTYSLVSDRNSVNEGDKVTFTLTSTGVSDNTVLYWAAISTTGANPADITSPSPPLGSFTVTGNSATIELTVATDAFTPETGESFYINLYASQTDRDNFVSEIASSNTVTIINIPPSATYSFTSPGSGTAISEGGSTSFTVTTTNISNGTVLYWAAFSDTGAVANDISSPFPPQGTVTINSNTGTISITVATDAITPETGESFYLRLYSTEVSRNLYGTGVATSNAVSITDVPPSAPSPSYSFTSPASSTSASEGSIVNFTISTSNVANGTTLYWAAIATGTAGPSDAYPTGSPTSPPQGTVTISNNSGSISVTIATDLETPESNEGFYLNLYTSQANRDSFVSEVASSQTVTITNVAPGSTYSFSSPAAGTAVNEGDTVTFTVSTTNVANGTTLYWAAIGINGAGQADASNPSPPQGTVTISSNSGTISLTIARDDLTPEAGEGVKINLYTTQANRDNFVSEVASSNIVDIRNSTYSISPNSTSVVEGNTVTYTVTTTNVSNGTTLYWTNSGTTVAADFSDSSNSGSFTIQNNTGTITRTISVGDTLEGTETIILQVRIGSTSGTVVATASTVNVTDTLPTSITYSITPNKNTLAAGDTIQYNITTTGVSDGTVLYLLENGSVSAGDFTDNYTQFIVTVLNNKASFSRTVSSSYVGTKTSVIRLLTGGYSGTLQVTAASVSVITLSISPTALSNGVQGISYSATLSTAGGSDSYTYSVISGSLPAGITLSAGTGIISGTPTSPGTSNFTIRSTDTNNNTTSRTYSIQITQATLNVLPTSLSVGTLNSPYSRTFTITGGSGNYSYSISSGSLPSGINLSSSGVLSGTPDVEQISSFILYVTDNTYNIFATKNYTLKIQSYVITLLPDKLENGTVKTYYKQLLEADNGIAPYTYSLVSGSLPLGLSLNSSTGEISGMPARQASKTFNIGVTDSLGKTLVKNYTINISPFVIRNTFNVSSIVISQLPDYIRGDYVSYE